MGSGTHDGKTMIDEVKAMAPTAESAGESLKLGSRIARDRAIEAGRIGADVAAQAAQVAEHRLSEGSQVARKEFAKTSRRARKEFAHQAARTRKEVAKSTAQARKVAAERREDLRAPGRKARKAAIQAAKSAGQSKRRAKRDFKNAKKEFKAAVAEAKIAAKGEHKKKRRSWPWLLGLAALAGAAAYATRPQQEPPIAPLPPRSTDMPSSAEPTDTPGAKGSPAGDGKESPSPKS